VAFNASTSHASTAPEKNVKPSPRSADATAHGQKPAVIHHIQRYSVVASVSVSVPSRYENLRPRTSAITPVGTSKTTRPAVKKALTANASPLLSPASSRNSVLMPQISDAASVCSSNRPR
jgi:hypothetical protein